MAEAISLDGESCNQWLAPFPRMVQGIGVSHNKKGRSAMSRVSREQSLEVMAKLGTNTDWSQLDSEVIQQIIKDPTGSGREFTRFLANGGRVTIVSTDGITAPEGGKIHIVSVPVDESYAWKDAVRAAGPDTDRDWDVWKVGNQYPSVASAKSALRQVILVNFGKYIRSEDAIAWGKTQNLRPASPRSVFAISENYPNLNRDLAMDYMAVVSLVPCSFGGERQVPNVWWYGSKRESHLSWFVIGWSEHCWFAFVRE